jgi:hypothetical protein
MMALTMPTPLKTKRRRIIIIKVKGGDNFPSC